MNVNEPFTPNPTPDELRELRQSTGVDFTLGYTIDDDGVHVYCPTCSWSECLGCEPTVRRVLDSVVGHLIARGGRGGHPA